MFRVSHMTDSGFFLGHDRARSCLDKSRKGGVRVATAKRDLWQEVSPDNRVGILRQPLPHAY